MAIARRFVLTNASRAKNRYCAKYVKRTTIQPQKSTVNDALHVTLYPKALFGRSLLTQKWKLKWVSKQARKNLYSRAKRIKQLENLRWFSQRRSQTPHFWGRAPGGYDPQIRTRPRCLYNAPTAKFYHPVFTRTEVIVLTNPQTNRRRWKHPTFFAIRYDVG